jgi:hypothetical protein
MYARMHSLVKDRGRDRRRGDVAARQERELRHARPCVRKERAATRIADDEKLVEVLPEVGESPWLIALDELEGLTQALENVRRRDVGPRVLHNHTKSVNVVQLGAKRIVGGSELADETRKESRHQRFRLVMRGNLCECTSRHDVTCQAGTPRRYWRPLR